MGWRVNSMLPSGCVTSKQVFHMSFNAILVQVKGQGSRVSQWRNYLQQRMHIDNTGNDT